MSIPYSLDANNSIIKTEENTFTLPQINAEILNIDNQIADLNQQLTDLTTIQNTADPLAPSDGQTVTYVANPDSSVKEKVVTLVPGQEIGNAIASIQNSISNLTAQRSDLAAKRDKIAVAIAANPPQAGEIKLPVILAVLFLGCAIIFGLTNYDIKVSASRHVRCSNFKTYQEAKQAYDNGAKYLDGNHDGIPCNSLYKQVTPKVEYGK